MPMQPSEATPAALSLPGSSNSKLVAALAAYEGGQKIWNQSKELYRRYFGYSVSISERDPLFPDIYEWLLSIMPDERHRSLSVASPSTSGSYDTVGPMEDSSTSEEEKPKPLIVRFDDTASRYVSIDGHRIRVKKDNPEVAANRVNLNELMSREPPAAKINFYAQSYAGQQAVLRELDRINDARRTTRKAVLRMVNSWGSWRTRSDLPPRTLESVALPANQKERIVADLGKFLGEEADYNRLAMPYHRSYMFTGPPGTGKTSLIKALVSHYNLDLWYISLSDLKTESSLLGLLSEVGPRSALLLEDIDNMKITQTDDVSEPGSISLSSLLNTLDGVATPHGLISFMTTNYFHNIDPRLTREGRMDVIEELGYPSTASIADFYKHFYGFYPNWIIDVNDDPIDQLSMSKVSELFKKYMKDPESADKFVYELMCEFMDAQAPAVG